MVEQAPAKLDVHPVGGVAERVGAQELQRLGYLDEVVSSSELSNVVDRYTKQIAELAPLAMEGMKRALNESSKCELDLDATNSAIDKTMRSADLKAGLIAWAKREKPVFMGE